MNSAISVVSTNVPSHPWSIAWLPDGSALVTERDGRLRRLRDGQLDPTTISGLPPVLATGQGGLRDVSLHPDFADNRLVYLTLAISNPWRPRARVHGFPVGMPGSVTNYREYHHQP